MFFRFEISQRVQKCYGAYRSKLGCIASKTKNLHGSFIAHYCQRFEFISIQTLNEIGLYNRDTNQTNQGISKWFKS